MRLVYPRPKSIGADLTARFAALGSKCVELDAADRLRILHDFYRAGEEETFHFDMADMARKGHDFKDYICPDAMEKHSDYLKLGDRYCRVLFLKDYASYIKDDFVTVLTDLTRSMMLSIDILSVPTDEAVREVENRLLGVETNTGKAVPAGFSRFNRCGLLRSGSGLQDL